MMLARIVAPHFVAGVDMARGYAAPIVRFMSGWTRARIERYCLQRKWRVEFLTDEVSHAVQISGATSAHGSRRA